ncbi:unnamed protein product [Allacma fusca]|uniref:HMG box domain-containing protein n=1 Tax=Allacma fusca TaxID=39272 RepID=A0A8J2PMI9_9HEXA|nr:unnamed protein product [Allacma fusca]
MSSFKWIANSLKNLRITGTGAGGQNVQARYLGTPAKQEIPVKPMKRPLNGYFRYAVKNFPEIVKKNPGKQSSELMKICSQQWRGLGDMEKEKYWQGYKTEMEGYKKVMDVYNNSLTPAQKDALEQAKEEKATKRDKFLKKKRLQELGRPKKPRTAYFIFADDHGDLKSSKSPEECRQKVVQVSEKWRKMSEAEKAPYFVKYQEEMDSYVRALAKWEEKMIRMGNDDLLGSRKSAKA